MPPPQSCVAGSSAIVPAYEEGNELAGMFIPLDYYAIPARGAILEWRNEMPEATWLYWLTYDRLTTAERVHVPTLFVHGDGCALPDNVKRIHARMTALRTSSGVYRSTAGVVTTRGRKTNGRSREFRREICRSS